MHILQIFRTQATDPKKACLEISQMFSSMHAPILNELEAIISYYKPQAPLSDDLEKSLINSLGNLISDFDYRDSECLSVLGCISQDDIAYHISEIDPSKQPGERWDIKKWNLKILTEYICELSGNNNFNIYKDKTGDHEDGLYEEPGFFQFDFENNELKKGEKYYFVFVDVYE